MYRYIHGYDLHVLQTIAKPEEEYINLFGFNPQKHCDLSMYSPAPCR